MKIIFMWPNEMLFVQRREQLYPITTNLAVLVNLSTWQYAKTEEKQVCCAITRSVSF